MATQRVQIPIAFSYNTTVSGQTVSVPAAGSTVTVIDRNTSNPATVFTGFAGGSTIASVVTDAGGNVPGYVVEGSYSLTAAAVGSFGGATVNWEAVRGDGVENYFPGSITLSALAAAVTQALVPTGSMLPFGGASAPAGWHLCDGSVQAQVGTFANLFAVIGSAYNTGGEGAGNFRLPNSRQNFLLGKATSGTGSTLGGYGGVIDHFHTLATHTHPMPSVGVISTMPAHTHPLGNDGAVQIGIIGFGLGAALVLGNPYSNTSFPTVNQLVSSPSQALFAESPGANPWPGFALVGNTQLSGTPVIGGATGPSTTGVGGPAFTAANNPPFMVVNHIIKL